MNYYRMFGYMGKLLRVNLTDGTLTEEALDAETARDYIGGTGYATRLVYNEVPPQADPLGPDSKLVFMTGPLTGTTFPTASRYQVCTKSPLTGIWVDASSSGFWGAELKRTGYDGIIVEGVSSRPVYLLITDDKAELRDASSLWGQDTRQVVRSIRKELQGRRVRVASVGPAGERQVLITSVMNDEGRAAGRGGVGAVMGSKRLKAIAVKGTKKVPMADGASLRRLAREAKADLTGPSVSALSKWGTAAAMDIGWVTGDIPVQNWRKGLWKEGCINLGGRRIADTILRRRGACLRCPIQCSRRIQIVDGLYRMEGPGPEYQTLATFGPLCLNDDLEAVCAANDLCNRYGLDTVSTGSAIAFAMEAYERGILSQQDTGGLDLAWGDAKVILELVRQIGERRGLGELLGQGVKRAAEKLGKESESFAVHVKGLEVPMHDPRAFFSLAVNYATGPRGADHMRGNAMAYETGLMAPQEAKQGRFAKEGKGQAAKMAQDRASVVNSMIICMFAAQHFTPDRLATILNAVTGFDYTAQEVLKVGERIINLQRAFNLRCGVSGPDDKLPPRLLEPTTEGGHAGKVPDVRHQLQEYYELRGWTAEGKPSREKLGELGLEEVAEQLDA